MNLVLPPGLHGKADGCIRRNATAFRGTSVGATGSLEVPRTEVSATWRRDEDALDDSSVALRVGELGGRTRVSGLDVREAGELNVDRFGSLKADANLRAATLGTLRFMLWNPSGACISLRFLRGDAP